MTRNAVASFLRGAALGVELQEAWVVCNAATYIWNYYNHVLQSERHREITDCLQTLLDAFKETGHTG